MLGTGRARAVRRLGPLAALVCACAFPAHAQTAGTDSLRLHWTAPGDDGMAGAAAAYEVRQSLAPIVTEADYALAEVIPGPPTPGPAATWQTMRVRGLAAATTYWFCVRSVDEAGNWSGLSNVLRWDGQFDTAPPNAPASVAAVPEDEGKMVRVSWRANSEPDLAGYYVFRSPTPQGPWEEAGRVDRLQTEFLDQRLPLAPVLAYQVAAYDSRGNISPRSRAVTVDVAAAVPDHWRLMPAYPNPARADERQRIPVAAPAAAVAVIEVRDASDTRVRRLEGVRRAPGLMEFEWDGRNDAGRLCAPGVYHARLVADDGVRHSIRLARLP